MKRTVFSMGLIATALVLAGCTGGTTYGTGTSHEEATMKGLGNIFSLKPQKTLIDYNQRPELVMPANKNILPAPMTKEAALTNTQWPETPEQRIAKARSDAPEPNWRDGSLPIEYLTDTNKVGIRNSARIQKNARRKTKSGGDQLLEAIRDDANGVGEGKLARERREQIAYSTGTKRKFLTEPPTEYRTPSANAEAGDLGISNEKLDARQKAEKANRIAVEKGTLLN